jgi:drug/metabolite transporter (DMT)-like permease
MYAAYQLATYRARADVDTVWYLWIVSLIGAVILLTLCIVQAMPLWGFDAQTWLALLGLALVTHVVGWLAVNYAFGYLPPSLASVTLLGQPVMTALLAVPLLGEPIRAEQIAGGAFVLAGITVVNRRGRSR